MSRWICVDDICIQSDENDWEELVAFADAIAEQEPIDIVRCGECKHWNEEDHWCNIRDSYGWNYKPDDFCSYGSRSEKPNNCEDEPQTNADQHIQSVESVESVGSNLEPFRVDELQTERSE